MKKPKILVVEDEIIIAHDLQIMLRNLGYSVPYTASSGEEAIKIAQDIKPDLTIMDIKLSGEIDGIEASKKFNDGFDIPVIFLTAYIDSQTLERAKETEPLGYLTKPINGRELSTIIKKVLSINSNRMKNGFIDVNKKINESTIKNQICEIRNRWNCYY